MPRRINQKCQHCARLDVEAAVSLHGPTGDNCWNPQICHRKRSHYRHRDDNNAIRRRLRRSGQSVTSYPTLEVESVPPPPPPISAAAVLVLYRQHSDAPVHAVAAEVWQGEHKIAEVKAVHCSGLRADKVTAYIKELLSSLNQQFGVIRFEDKIKEIPIEHCPITPCPLKTF